MAYKNIVIFLTFSFLSSSLTSSVPVITWWYGSGLTFPSSTSNILSGHTLKLSDVFDKYFHPLCEKSNVMLMFLQDELSINDFTKHPSSFPFVQESLENKKQVVLPAVSQDRGSFYEAIRGNSHYNVIEVFAESNWNSYLSKDNLDENKVNVFVLHLEPVGDASPDSKSVILKRNDATMKLLTSNFLQKIPKFIVVYTATEPSKEVSNLLLNEQVEDDETLNSRHLLAKEAAAATQPGKLFNSTGCVYMYLTGLKFGKGDMVENLNATNFQVVDGTCNPSTNYSIGIKLKAAQGSVKDFTMIISLSQRNTSNEWVCNYIDVTGTLNGTKVDKKFDCGDTSHDEVQNTFRPWTGNSQNTIVSPLQYSFACGSLVFTSGHNKTEKAYALHLDGFQLQPNMRYGKSFAGAYNCVGFFSLEILTGLLVVFLLIASLFMGTMMMMNIQTQDRFDDPKGKTIMVATAE